MKLSETLFGITKQSLSRPMVNEIRKAKRSLKNAASHGQTSAIIKIESKRNQIYSTPDLAQTVASFLRKEKCKVKISKHHRCIGTKNYVSLTVSW